MIPSRSVLQLSRFQYFKGIHPITVIHFFNAIQVVKSMKLTRLTWVYIGHIYQNEFVLTINIQFHSIHDFTLFDKWITRPTSKPFADVLHLWLIRENTNSSISITRGLERIINLIILCVIKNQIFLRYGSKSSNDNLNRSTRKCMKKYFSLFISFHLKHAFSKWIFSAF